MQVFLPRWRCTPPAHCANSGTLLLSSHVQVVDLANAPAWLPVTPADGIDALSELQEARLLDARLDAQMQVTNEGEATGAMHMQCLLLGAAGPSNTPPGECPPHCQASTWVQRCGLRRAAADSTVTAGTSPGSVACSMRSM